MNDEFPPMNPELKQRWIEALESGKYRKRKGELRGKNGTMCCLGVLCDLINPEGWYYDDSHGNDHEVWNSSISEYTGWAYDDPRVMLAADLNDTTPGYPIGYIMENF